ncbi:MAG: hypothetical protein PHO82_12085 [Mesotoga sp.]|uniref:hypothetical protein n=1 Tax=Mesotoga sp. TaxID=2053577 RepID=UPI002606EC5B|nr:hypothetical protein [Mesotoga sp.]MDD5684058.1 hypothetical protein [Mesotoga sp.]
MVASRSEVMLPPAGSEARWREEVMPGRASGEVMLALVRQEEEEEPVVEFLICDLIRNHAGLVGANGRSPEKGPGWNLCLLREKWDLIIFIRKKLLLR